MFMSTMGWQDNRMCYNLLDGGHPVQCRQSFPCLHALPSSNSQTGLTLMHTSSLRTINTILKRDAKDATYKFALLRATDDAC